MSEGSASENISPVKDLVGAKTIGAVLVVGGGVGGIQTSLDLADNGYKVYLVEEKPAIGGVMAQLDKTFPTNDCSLCILSPKLVDIARHPNVTLFTNAQVEEISGSAGNFSITVNQKARYVTDACVGCGLCAEACVLAGRFENEFDEGLKKRGAIYIPYPQAVPLQYVIDGDQCLQLKHGKCVQKCVEACDANAIDFNLTETTLKLDVGAVILSPGYKTFDAERIREYGYGRFPNVVTSLEFERILSASGPSQGHVLRPSDQRKPKKIAWIQCVGSRDSACGNNYCSSVCCTYAIKETIIAKEHDPTIDPTIFFMDMRTHGKGFEAYYNRAKDVHGIRFIRCRISDIQEDPGTRNLLIRYENEEGEFFIEEFDLAVLSVGIEPSPKIRELAERTGIALNEYGFCDTAEFSPMDTSVPGIFTCGAFAGPKDIPETVMEASAAAARASGLISAQRNTLVEKKIFVPEMDVSGKDPRIGVFVCHCGINIGAYVDVPSVVEYAKGLPNVVFADDNLYTCSQDAQRIIVDTIREHDLNRLIVASCTPRTHEPLFQETIREAGLNTHLFEMANIRDQCSWVHMNEKDAATSKARDQVRMAVAKASFIEPLSEITLPVIQSGLIIGGGLAGMTAALSLAEQGFEAHIVEREDRLGGNLRNIHYTLRNDNIRDYLDSLIAMVIGNPLITVHLNASLEIVDGFVGNYRSTIEGGDDIVEVDHGAIIVATGAEEFKPTEYLYGDDDRVMTQLELEDRLSRSEGRNALAGKTVVMIQCVGSRDDQHSYCSRVCCSDAVKNAIKLKEADPDTQVFVLYRDMRTYGFREIHYERARELGVIFLRYDLAQKPEVKMGKNRHGEDVLDILTRDRILGEDIAIQGDFLVLSPAVVPRKDNIELAKKLKVPLNEDGFFLEAHVKLRPVDFATEGIFLAGMAHFPKSIDEAISQAYAAASRACTLLSRGEVSVDPTIATINEGKCIGCGLCMSICPYKAMRLELKEGGRKAVVISASCKGCGTCASSCPQFAIITQHFTDQQITAQIEAFLEEGTA